MCSDPYRNLARRTRAAAVGLLAIMAFGSLVAAGAGDVNGDGYDKVLVGAKYFDDGHRSDGGGVWIYRGTASGPAPSAVWVEHPLPSGGLFGGDLAAGDFDGDRSRRCWSALRPIPALG